MLRLRWSAPLSLCGLWRPSSARRLVSHTACTAQHKCRQRAAGCAAQLGLHNRCDHRGRGAGPQLHCANLRHRLFSAFWDVNVAAVSTGFWAASAVWSASRAPCSTDIVTIGSGSPVRVTLAGAVAVRGLRLGGPGSGVLLNGSGLVLLSERLAAEAAVYPGLPSCPALVSAHPCSRLCCRSSRVVRVVRVCIMPSSRPSGTSFLIRRWPPLRHPAQPRECLATPPQSGPSPVLLLVLVLVLVWR